MFIVRITTILTDSADQADYKLVDLFILEQCMDACSEDLAMHKGESPRYLESFSKETDFYRYYRKRYPCNEPRRSKQLLLDL
ncbi:hypothetical protein PoB_003291400 [Plakobranchus ocellatus]|uniref:Uncharacterized protein n=1 Tax=Plakobranchus ocellatus TaxID=259542 RepID=A0AAV4AFF0_9GAST|nr:hypothetical protein PoB_003291400 [Plakobranchus ocellatus]